ncbi:MAG: hypothetical protein LBP26_05980 [Clostridiales bacterium]|jgi:hypothetical protein|nr:hypothetical protein [Clostridiales bacterium]
MGLLHSIKKSVIRRSIIKRKETGGGFDVDAADNFVIPPDAPDGYNDSHYFTLHNFNSGECLYWRLGRRGGAEDDEVWLVYRDSRGAVYVAESDKIAKGAKLPARVECVEAGKTLKFHYDGKVKKAGADGKTALIYGGGELVDFKLDGEFSGTGDCFEFTHHLSAETLANALAREKFSNLKAFRAVHQTHYEQAGTASAKIDIGGKKISLDGFSCVRDHSYGVREWNYFDRYVWNIILLQNGDLMHVSFIRYPSVRNLKAGFYMSGNSCKSILDATPLDDIPATGSVPDSFGFDVTMIDGEKKRVECKLDFVCPFKFKGDFSCNEGVAEFYVDGVRGRGIAEFAYNKDVSRWRPLNKSGK